MRTPATLCVGDHHAARPEVGLEPVLEARAAAPATRRSAGRLPCARRRGAPPRRRCPGAARSAGCSGTRAGRHAAARPASRPGAGPSSGGRPRRGSCRLRSAHDGAQRDQPEPVERRDLGRLHLADPQLGVDLAQGRVEREEARPAPAPARAGRRKPGGSTATSNLVPSSRAATDDLAQLDAVGALDADDDVAPGRAQAAGVDVAPGLVGRRRGQHAPARQRASCAGSPPALITSACAEIVAGVERPADGRRVAPAASTSPSAKRSAVGRHRCSPPRPARGPSAAHQSQNAEMRRATERSVRRKSATS